MDQLKIQFLLHSVKQTLLAIQFHSFQFIEDISINLFAVGHVLLEFWYAEAVHADGN